MTNTQSTLTTELINAIETNNSLECERLIALGADVHIVLDSQDNLLTMITKKPKTKFNVRILQLLINAVCDIEYKFTYMTPLVWAVINNNLEACECLLQHGANVNTKMMLGFTPLFIASTNDYMYDLCVLLVDYGADVFVESERGNRASEICHTLNTKICEFLKQKEKEREMLNMCFKRANHVDDTDAAEYGEDSDQEVEEEILVEMDDEE